MSAANASQSILSGEDAVAFLSNPLSPCPPRVSVAQQVIQQLPPEASMPAIDSATAIDPRCAPMITFQSELALQSGNLELAETATAEGIEFDPLFDVAWILRGEYLLAIGDIAGAEAAAAEAQRVQALYPEQATSVQDLLARIATARG